jgi:hypothetical protein
VDLLGIAPGAVTHGEAEADVAHASGHDHREALLLERASVHRELRLERGEHASSQRAADQRGARDAGEHRERAGRAHRRVFVIELEEARPDAVREEEAEHRLRAIGHDTYHGASLFAERVPAQQGGEGLLRGAARAQGRRDRVYGATAGRHDRRQLLRFAGGDHRGECLRQRAVPAHQQQRVERLGEQRIQRRGDLLEVRRRLHPLRGEMAPKTFDDGGVAFRPLRVGVDQDAELPCHGAGL